VYNLLRQSLLSVQTAQLVGCKDSCPNEHFDQLIGTDVMPLYEGQSPCVVNRIELLWMETILKMQGGSHILWLSGSHSHLLATSFRSLIIQELISRLDSRTLRPVNVVGLLVL